MFQLALALATFAHAGPEAAPPPATPPASPTATHDLLAITVYALVRIRPGAPQTTVAKFAELKTDAAIAPLGLYSWGPKTLTFTNLQSGRSTDLAAAGPVSRAWVLGDHLLYEGPAGIHVWDGAKGADSELARYGSVLAVHAEHRLALVASGSEVALVRFDAEATTLAKLPGAGCVTGAFAPDGAGIVLATSAMEEDNCAMSTTLATYGPDGVRQTTVTIDASVDVDAWQADGTIALTDRIPEGDFITHWRWTRTGAPTEAELPGPAARTVPDGVKTRRVQGQPELFVGEVQISDFAGLPAAPREPLFTCDLTRTVEARRIGPDRLLATVVAFDCDDYYLLATGSSAPAWAVVLDTGAGPSAQVVLAGPDREFTARKVVYSPSGGEALVNDAVVVGPDGKFTRLVYEPAWVGWLPNGKVESQVAPPAVSP